MTRISSSAPGRCFTAGKGTEETEQEQQTNEDGNNNMPALTSASVVDGDPQL